MLEEILTAEEGVVASKYERVFIVRSSNKFTVGDLEKILDEFKAFLEKVQTGDEDESKIKELHGKYVRYYEPIY